jgi:hypothetical protein
LTKSKYPGTAEFSEDALYRYTLTRENLIPGNDRVLVDIGLNPSTATADEDDRTIAKGIVYALAWGFGRLVKLNAYTYRTKSPKIMFSAKSQGIDIVGPANDRWILDIVELANRTGGKVLCSWGGNIEPFRQEQLVELLKGVELWCVKQNEDRWGTPAHYLYQKNSSTLIPWVYRKDARLP